MITAQEARKQLDAENAELNRIGIETEIKDIETKILKAIKEKQYHCHLGYKVKYQASRDWFKNLGYIIEMGTGRSSFSEIVRW